MTASVAAFADSIQILNMDELRSFLVEMEEERQLLNAMITEFQRTSTELHRSYSQMEMELRAAQKNLREAEKKYAQVCEQNTYLLKQVYGRSSEKAAALKCVGQEDYVDPLSESAMPEQTVSSSDYKKENSNILHPSSGKHGHKRAGWKNTVVEKLPVYHEYELDVEKLDSLYVAYNWRICSHGHLPIGNMKHPLQSRLPSSSSQAVYLKPPKPQEKEMHSRKTLLHKS